MSVEALRPVIVAKKVNEAHNMASFELVDPDGAELPAFSAGSHIDVTISDNLIRQYSLCNSATERHCYLIGVWRDANSRGGSKALHDVVKEGDTLKVGLPRNRFRVPKATKRAVLLARGIGLTPILSIADHLKSKAVPFELHYVYALMSPGAFEGKIRDSSFADETSFYIEDSAQNRVLDAAKLLAAQPEDTQLFICGADWWQDPIVAAAKQKGLLGGAHPYRALHGEGAGRAARQGVRGQDRLDRRGVQSPRRQIGHRVPGRKGREDPDLMRAGNVRHLQGQGSGRRGRPSRQAPESRRQGRGYFLPCVSRAKGGATSDQA